MLVQVGVPDSPLVVTNTCPGVAGVLAWKPENTAMAVFAVASAGSVAMPLTARFGSGKGSMWFQAAMPVPSTDAEAKSEPAEEPVYSTSFPPNNRGNAVIQLK